MTKTMLGGMLTWLCGLFMLMALLGSITPTKEADIAEESAAPHSAAGNPH